MRALLSGTMSARLTLTFALLLGVAAGASPQEAATEKHPYNVQGTFGEGCSCSAPCGCQLTGVEHGCTGVGGMSLTRGSYRGANLSGVKIAYATVPGQWVRLYVDTPMPEQREAAEAFARAVYTAFGPIEAVKPARIEITGQGGKHTVSVDDGKVMQLTTEPVLGGNKKTPIVISNTHDPLHPTVMQGKTISGSFQDGERSFTLKDSNSYFTERMRSRGRL